MACADRTQCSCDDCMIGDLGRSAWEANAPGPAGGSGAWLHLGRTLYPAIDPAGPRVDYGFSCGCAPEERTAGVACVPNGSLCICFVQCLPGPPDGLHDCGETRVTSRPSCGPTVYSDALDWMDDTIDDLVDDWDDLAEGIAENMADAAWGLLTYTGEPPGDCTEARHRELQDAVDAACKTVSRSCNPSQSCAELSRRWTLNEACVDARQLIMDECFRGGDKKHEKPLVEATRALEKCRENYEKKGC